MTLTFIANGQPKEILSPKNAGIWNGKEKVWRFAGIGLASFCVPPWNGLHQTVRLLVSKNK